MTQQDTGTDEAGARGDGEQAAGSDPANLQLVDDALEGAMESQEMVKAGGARWKSEAERGCQYGTGEWFWGLVSGTALKEGLPEGRVEELPGAKCPREEDSKGKSSQALWSSPTLCCWLLSQVLASPSTKVNSLPGHKVRKARVKCALANGASTEVSWKRGNVLGTQRQGGLLGAGRGQVILLGSLDPPRGPHLLSTLKSYPWDLANC